MVCLFPGDPTSFKLFLDQKGFRFSELPRYVGNRLNILFVFGSRLYHRHSDLLEYMDSWWTTAENLKGAMMNDLIHPEIIDNLQVLGLVDKYITGPWMRITYRRDGDSIHHISVVSKIKESVEVLLKASQEPKLLFGSDLDMFQNHLEMDEELLSLINDISSRVLEKIAGLCSILAGVIEKQYSVYYFQHTFTEKELTETQNAPLHNILSEHLLGIVDVWVRKSPNASIDFVSSVLKAKHNNTMEWLLLKSYEEKEKLIRFSIGRGRVCRSIKKGEDFGLQTEKAHTNQDESPN